jgi:DNA polymerase-3 subunit delta'
LTTQGLNGTEAQIWLKAAGERPLNALDLAQHSGLAAQDWVKIPKSVAAGEVSMLTQLDSAQVVDVLQKLCHDMLARSVGADGVFFETQSLPQTGSFRALSNWSRDLIQSAKTAEHPFNKGLMLEALVSQAKLAMT